VASLYVRIDRERRIASFSGPGTFNAKEVIKTLGAAKWNNVSKEWEVSGFTLSVEEVSSKFDDVSVEESSGSLSSAAVHRGAGGSEKKGNASRQLAALVAEAGANKPASVEITPETVVDGKVPNGISVSEFTHAARQALKARFPTTIFIHGVLASVKEARGGRVYMDLADAEKPDTTVSCVIWQNGDAVLAPLTAAGFVLEAELQVMFKVQVDINPRRASLSLVVVGVVAEYTLGKLAALREKTNERLKQEGLFDRNREQQLAFLPRRLALLTSSGGTVINDFRASLDEARFGFELFWLNVSVQGADAKSELVAGLETLSRHRELDAVLVFRGGGSAADLAVFSEYEVARAICLCPIPVFSAIGHQEDQSSTQDVSYLSQGVPKDLGRFFADIVRERRRVLVDSAKTITNSSERLVERLQQRVNDVAQGMYSVVRQVVRSHSEAIARWELALPTLVKACMSETTRRFSSSVQPMAVMAAQSFRNRALRLTYLIEKMESLGVRILTKAGHSLSVSREISAASMRVLETKHFALDSLNRIITEAGPETQLKRGFAMVRRQANSELVLSAKALRPNDEITLEFIDASKNAKII
jgi:exodeoxyribonuclease VII large subunit